MMTLYRRRSCSSPCSESARSGRLPTASSINLTAVCNCSSVALILLVLTSLSTTLPWKCLLLYSSSTSQLPVYLTSLTPTGEGNKCFMVGASRLQLCAILARSDSIRSHLSGWHASGLSAHCALHALTCDMSASSASNQDDKLNCCDHHNFWLPDSMSALVQLTVVSYSLQCGSVCSIDNMLQVGQVCYTVCYDQLSIDSGHLTPFLVYHHHNVIVSSGLTKLKKLAYNSPKGYLVHIQAAAAVKLDAAWQDMQV